MNNGYEEARKIDDKINELIVNQPLTKESAMEWWKFTRTIKSGLEIVEEEAKTLLGIKTEEIAAQKSGNKNDYPKTGPIIKE